jgi:GNAT superfamily N-acetyltransferase
LITQQITVSDVDEIDAGLADDMLRCWVDVSNAGGAVGFVPPVAADDVRPLVEQMAEAVAAGRELLVVVTVDGTLAGFGVIQLPGNPLLRHYGRVLRVQVRPELHKLGLGAALMEGIRDRAMRAGLEGITLGVRDGSGIDSFYARLGYVEVGRTPGMIRVAPGDDRDGIEMFLRLP